MMKPTIRAIDTLSVEVKSTGVARDLGVGLGATVYHSDDASRYPSIQRLSITTNDLESFTNDQWSFILASDIKTAGESPWIQIARPQKRC